jgi:hypothetical protein
MSYKKRNPVAKDLKDPLFRQRVRDTNRRHLINKLHEEEAEEELDDFLHQLGKAPKE